MQAAARKLHRNLGEQFEAFAATIEELHSLSEVKPRTRQEAISVLEGGAATRFQFGPVVVRLPERAYISTADLFVVVEGSCDIEPTDGRFLHISTKTAYFRQKGDAMEHILAAHYDFDPDSDGHPVFHLQLDSRPELQELPVSKFRLETEQLVDFTRDVLRTSRVPCAHMDFFAVLLQLVADHLIVGSTHAQRGPLFARIRTAGHISSGIGIEPPCTQEKELCLRASHWYRALA